MAAEIELVPELHESQVTDFHSLPAFEKKKIILK